MQWERNSNLSTIISRSLGREQLLNSQKILSGKPLLIFLNLIANSVGAHYIRIRTNVCLPSQRDKHWFMQYFYIKSRLVPTKLHCQTRHWSNWSQVKKKKECTYICMNILNAHIILQTVNCLTKMDKEYSCMWITCLWQCFDVHFLGSVIPVSDCC